MKAGKVGVGFDEKNQALKVAGADRLDGMDKLSKNDLSSLQLPADALSELPPLSGRLTDSEYMPVIDSMRNVAMKAKGYSLDESEVTDEMKTSAYGMCQQRQKDQYHLCRRARKPVDEEQQNDQVCILTYR